jgi:hypothetical protein
MLPLFLALRRKARRSPRLTVIHYGGRQPSPWTEMRLPASSDLGGVAREGWETGTPKRSPPGDDLDAVVHFLTHNPHGIPQGRPLWPC